MFAERLRSGAVRDRTVKTDSKTLFFVGQGTLEIYNPDEDLTSVYETYRTDAEHPYVSGYVPETESDDEVDSESSEEASEDTSEELQAETDDNEPDIREETQGLENDQLYVDEDGWEDTVEHSDSGIRDIIITGTVRLQFHSWFLSYFARVPCAH